MKNIFTLPMAAFILASCGVGSGEGLNDQGLPIKSNDNPNTTNPEATLTHIQETIFGAICARCHTGAAAPRGLRLDSEENSYAFLVSRAADEKPELLRVNPGKPDESYMVKKIQGDDDIVGGQMPLGGPYLSKEQITLVRDWIANGAPRTGTGGNTKVSQQKSRVSDADHFIADIHFSRALQADAFLQNSVQVSLINNSGELMDTKNFSITFAEQNLHLDVDLAAQEAVAVDVRITNTNVLDSEGKALDGDNDGIEGGDYHHVYPL
ncbi:hypothetical protein GCM10011613_33790 [Cellvibrio zantedeschiae]|uniref:Cytochrome c domain-containing protein n=1 Tax=Cellvibrio zantedeschiae TaxID=1237077 RepID=A0ABQ3BAJ3_9GAMM|nr:c-type cytochrome domain-containing protein [Cellvibrio zantedeschiae]GGY86019.1 hypothetical protein GCM10011613_33790 [Cellvibrio zantedeschiae]